MPQHRLVRQAHNLGRVVACQGSGGHQVPQAADKGQQGGDEIAVVEDAPERMSERGPTVVEEVFGDGVTPPPRRTVAEIAVGVAPTPIKRKTDNEDIRERRSLPLRRRGHPIAERCRKIGSVDAGGEAVSDTSPPQIRTPEQRS